MELVRLWFDGAEVAVDWPSLPYHHTEECDLWETGLAHKDLYWDQKISLSGLVL